MELSFLHSNSHVHKIFLHSFSVLFSKLLDIVHWKIEISKNNSTVLKKKQTVIYFSTKKYNLHNFSIYVSKIFYQYNFHTLFYIQILLNIVFFFFSAHKLYTILNNLHKITFTPYIVNQIDD